MGGKERLGSTPETSGEKDQIWRNIAIAVSASGAMNPGTDFFTAARFQAWIHSKDNQNSSQEKRK